MSEIDTIALMIDNIRRLSHSMKYEEAQYILEKIKEELLKPKIKNLPSFKGVFINVISTPEYL